MSRWGVAAVAVAALVAGLFGVSGVAHAQSPSSVPAARFYGVASGPAGGLPTNLTITASVAGVTCSGTQSIPGSQSNSGTDNGGNYVLDIQAVAGCTTPGATVTFTAGAYRARETGTIPDIPGTAVHLDLHFQLPATPTAAARTPTAAPSPPPPPPTQVRTAVPPPPTTATVPPRTPTAVVVQRPVTQQAPKGPVTAQAPKKGAAAPVYQAPVAQAPAVAPRLPSTGTGGLLDQQSSNSLTGWALAIIVLAALGVSASGVFAYRRSSR